MIKKQIALGVALACSAGAASALEPNGIPFGPFRAYPSLSYDLKYEDNVYRTESNEQDAWVNVLTPAIELRGLSGPNAYVLGYELSKAWYSEDGGRNDYLHHRLYANAALEFATRHHLDLNYEFKDWTDPRGTDFEADEVVDVVRDTAAGTDVDEWHQHQLGGTYTFGAPSARGRLELHADQAWRRYDNNGQEYRDRDATTLGATFYARVMPKTSLLFEVAQTDIDYVNEGAAPPGSTSLDSTERRYLAGVTWDATAKTTGTAKVGYLTKDFDDGSRDDFSGSSWEVGVTWRPLTYSAVDLTTSRSTSEQTTGTDDYVLTKDFGIAWTHDWGVRLSTKFDAKWAWDEYNTTDREDDRSTYGMGLTYALNRWLDLGASYRYLERDSSAAGKDYDNNTFMLTVKAAL